MQRRIFIVMTLILTFAISCTIGSVAHAKPSALLRALQEIDRNMCRNVKATCKTKHRNHAKKLHVAPVKKPKPDPAPVVEKVATPAVPPPKKMEIVTKSPVAKPETQPPLPHLKPLRPVAIILPTPAIIPKIEPPNEATPNASDETCLQQLRSQGAEFTIAADTVDSGLCHVYNPVRLQSVIAQKHVIKLPETPLLNCKYALQFSKWLSESAAPILAAQSNSQLEKLSTGPGFQCRGRNGDSSAKISEHGYGNAVDISSFHLANGKDIIVGDALNPNAASFATLHGLRSSACGYFTTVLGPGSNAAHATHFHLDLGMHGKSGNYRICE